VIFAAAVLFLAACGRLTRPVPEAGTVPRPRSSNLVDEEEMLPHLRRV